MQLRGVIVRHCRLTQHYPSQSTRIDWDRHCLIDRLELQGVLSLSRKILGKVIARRWEAVRPLYFRVRVRDANSVPMETIRSNGCTSVLVQCNAEKAPRLL
jgi:hypothetical protein